MKGSLVHKLSMTQQCILFSFKLGELLGIISLLACPQGTATGLLHETVLCVQRTRMPTAGEGSSGAQIKACFSGSQAMPLGLQVPCPEGVLCSHWPCPRGCLLGFIYPRSALP